MTDLPSGTVTFLVSDIESSTRLLQQLGPRHAVTPARAALGEAAWAAALAAVRLLRLKQVIHEGMGEAQHAPPTQEQRDG